MLPLHCVGGDVFVLFEEFCTVTNGALPNQIQCEGRKKNGADSESGRTGNTDTTESRG